jgi:hypothetical protein
MNRILQAGACLALASWLGGCSTVTGDFHQKLRIDAQDAQNRPVDGMQCQIGTGASALHVVTPATDVRVRRAMQSLTIECHRDSLVATATVKSHRERMEEALLPFGSAGVFIDHMSGALYAYPTSLHLRVGQHVVLEQGGEAQIVKSELLAPASATATARAAAPRTQLAALQPASAPAAAPAAALQKSRPAASPKANRAAARAPKSAATAAAGGTKPHASTPPNVVAVRSAPVNW